MQGYVNAALQAAHKAQCSGYTIHEL